MEGGSKMGNGKVPSAPKDDLESDDEKTFSNVNFDSVGEYNDYIRRRRRKKKLLMGSGSPSNEEAELEPLSPDMKSKLLDFEDMKQEETNLKPTFLPPPQLPEIVLTNNLDDMSKEKKKSDYKRAPRMNTFVGFLRLANYINASCVIFGVIASILMKEDEHSKPKEDEHSKPLSETDLDLEDVHDGIRHFVYVASGWVQISYLCVISLLTMIDAIGTVTFRWKEYGELSHSQTDATSVIFFLCKSRWTWRFGCGLSLASSISLATTMVMKEASNRDNFKSVPLNPLWFVALSTISVASSIIGWLLSLFPWHGVSWLYDHFKMKHVEDKGDIWTKTWGRQISAIYEGGQVTTKTAKQHNVPESWMAFVDVLALVSFFSSYTLAIGIYVFSIIIMPKRVVTDLNLWTVIVSALSSIFISLYALIFILINLIRVSGRCFSARQCGFNFKLPFAVKFFAPYVLTCASRLMMDIQHSEYSDYETKLPNAKLIVAFVYLHLMIIMFLVEVVRAAAYLNLCSSASKGCSALGNFIYKNIKEEGVNKKTVRFFDTLGSIFALTGMILGFTSLFVDQYDVNFSPEGVAKDVYDAVKSFQHSIEPVTTTLKKVIESLDRKFTCEDVYKVVGTSAAVTLFAGFFPGAGSVANVGSKSAYYGVRAANALTNLAIKLRKSQTIIWQIVSAVIKINRFVANHMKKVIIGTSTTSLAKLLPFMPPVVIGLYVLFGCFWPKRILFFSAKQRNKTILGMFLYWLLALSIQIIAVVINTYIVDEMIALLDENVPLAEVTLERKMGWTIAMAATAFALAGTLSFCIAYLILVIQTSNNHQNITNEELEWKAELEKRELLTINTAFGGKLEKRTQLKYKKDVIGPWTWILPITICLISCGFGILANFYPKVEMRREPRGPFGRLIDTVYRKISIYEDDMFRIRNDTGMECLPYPTFDDMVRSNQVLMKPVDRFFNETERIVRPLKTVMSGLRRQLILDIDEELFGGNMENFWDAFSLQYIGMVFVAPRVICLLILIFGWATSGLFICQMKIFQAIEPMKIVNAFGKVALFSLVYVCGSQLTFFNLLSSFGVPFYHIYVRFGYGFIYDLVADCIMLSLYTGMTNEFFFTIPKRKTVVYYTVPGVSEEGPNIHGEIK